MLLCDDTIRISDSEFKCGELTTAFLNYDVGKYKIGVDCLKTAHADKNMMLWAQAAELIWGEVALMPLYSVLAKQESVFSDIQLRGYATPEEHAPGLDCGPDIFSTDEFEQLLSDILFIQKRYAWFLESVFRYGNYKTDYVRWIGEDGMSALVSGRSLGDSPEHDLPSAKIQFEVVTLPSGEVRMYEKLEFHRLLNFIYLDLFRGMLHGHSPRICKNCGRWFFREKNAMFEYCGRNCTRRNEQNLQRCRCAQQLCGQGEK